MPMVKPAASKYLSQKWEAEQFRTHRIRVKNAPSMLNMSAPKQYPHLQLGLNRLAIQEDKQNRYDRENQMLLNKIRVIVKGHGTINNWNQWSRKDLHAAARMKRQREIEDANQSMLKRLKNVKPVVQRQKHEDDFKRHKAIQGMLDASVKDYDTPRTHRSTEQHANNEVDDTETRSEKSPKDDEKPEETPEIKDAGIDDSGKAEDKGLPPQPADKKQRKNKQPIENRKKNRTADVPKLPAI